jgi:hypothetical protein
VDWHIGVFASLPPVHPWTLGNSATLLQALQETVVRNVQLDSRWYTGTERMRKDAEDLVALAPDVIFALGGLVLMIE